MNSKISNNREKCWENNYIPLIYTISKSVLCRMITGKDERNECIYSKVTSSVCIELCYMCYMCTV